MNIMPFSELLQVNRPGSRETHSPKPVVGFTEATSTLSVDGVAIWEYKEQASSAANPISKTLLSTVDTPLFHAPDFACPRSRIRSRQGPGRQLSMPADAH